MKKTIQYVLYRYSTVQIVYIYILARVYRNNIQLFGVTSLYSTAALLDSVNCDTQLCVMIFALHNLTCLDYHWYGRHVRFTFSGGRCLSVGLL
jgi:hypothetical protein